MQLVSTHDGQDAAGLGSLLQIQQHLYAFCRMTGNTFVFPGFQNLSHYQYTDQSQQEYCDRVNSFVGFQTSGITPTGFVDETYLLKTWGEQHNEEKRKYIEELFSHINYEGVNYFSKDKRSIAVHIRAINSQDNCMHPNREYFQKGGDKEKYYDNLLEDLVDDGSEVHIFSQGEEADFSLFEEKYDAKLHLNDDIVVTLYHLIVADCLVSSNSSLSWCAHLYGQNKKVYARDNFFHSWYDETIIVKQEGKLK